MLRWRFTTNSLPARAGFSKPRVEEDGAAARGVRDARAIGPRSAINADNGGRIRPDRANRRCRCYRPMELGLREGDEGGSAATVRTSSMGGGVPRSLRGVLARAR